MRHHISSTLRLLTLLLVLAGAAPSADTPPTPERSPVVERAAAMEMKHTLARLAQERNQLQEENARLRSQHWLFLIYGGLVTALACWCGLRLLKLSSTPNAKAEIDTDIFASSAPAEGGTTAIRRKNATITIRNSSTQQAEVVERVQTRRFFARSDGDIEVEGRSTTNRLVRPMRNQSAPSAEDGAPGTTRMTRPQENAPTGPGGRPATVRVEQHSDRLEPVQVSVKPGTAPVVRSRGFSLMEVMISVAVLATVLTAVISSSFTLRQIQRSAQEQSQVEELANHLAERILGANWDWLGRDRPDDLDAGIEYQRGAWSWHRRATGRLASQTPVNPPLTETAAVTTNSNLIGVGLLAQPSGIDDLKVYLEYYRSTVLDAVFSARTAAIAPTASAPSGAASAPNAPSEEWAKLMTTATNDDHIMPESPTEMDLSTETRALVVRVIVTWNSHSGGGRRYELVFARRK
jgi:prepilin-type N-terminal cleavage/methylation domain-containing protein